LQLLLHQILLPFFFSHVGVVTDERYLIDIHASRISQPVSISQSAPISVKPD
jgi:hypothetical protein